ncbi:MAG TPA: surface carbohydrate biosynthesis protein [Novosphingobium sp.]|nr:surface carbohydrate biosynthesis protein [Novosphingobium sp.]
MNHPRIAFLPILTKARELDARVLLAALLAKRGFRVIVGNKSFVDYRARFARNAIYLCPFLVPVAEPRLRAFAERGHRIIGWDEEGLVYPDPNWYFSNRVGAGPARLCEALVAWGPASARDWLGTLPAEAPRPLSWGNARIDLLREPYRALHREEAESLRRRFGRYVLVNTNFDMVNHHDGRGALLRKMEASGRVATARDRERFADWERFRQTMFDAFLDGLPRLHQAMPDVNFVLRPHPSEDPAVYRVLAQRLPRLFVHPPEGSVLPWILGAVATVHNSCTTAVESYMLDVPVIAFDPPGVGEGAGDAMESPLPNMLSRRVPDWPGVAAALRELTDGPEADWITPDQRIVARDYIGSIVGPTASERIAQLAVEMAEKMPPSQIGRPGALRRARRAAGALAEVAGLRTLHSSKDDLRRFPGLPKQEIEALARRIGMLADVKLRVIAFERDTYIVEREQGG